MTEETQQDVSLMKQKFLTTFFKIYSDMIEFVNTLPIHGQFKLNAVTRLDEGMFWVREGVVQIQTLAPEAPKAAEPVSEPTPLE